MRPAAEQIEQLAPDEKSIVAARQSMALRHWSELGLSSAAVWGHYQGSAAYHVSIDLSNLGHRCNCPSRKRPCRHALALLMLLSSQVEVLPESETPASVQEWLDKRRIKAQKSAAAETAPAKPVDVEAQKKRSARREKRIQQGVEQLELFLCDIIRNGLAGVETQGFSLWEAQAKRLVDAQAGGLANRVRALGELPAASRDWPQRLLFAMGRLQLLLSALSRLSELPEEMQADVRQLVGWNVSQQELELAGERVTDEWAIIGQREEEEERFRTQRTWLLGRHTNRTALILQFAPGQRLFEQTLLPGTQSTGTIVFYPGSVPQRAKFLERSDQAVPCIGRLHGHSSFEEILSDYAHQLAQQPWLASSAFILKDATVSMVNDQWFLRDIEGLGVPLFHAEPWRLLAETGGQPTDFVFEWNGSGATILGLGMNQQFITI